MSGSSGNQAAVNVAGEWFHKLDEKSGILLELRADGSFAMHTRMGGMTAPDQGRWSLHKGHLCLASQNGTQARMAARLAPDRTVLSLDGAEFVNTTPEVPEKLCGTWSYFDQGSVVKGGYQVSRTLVLEPTGRFQFHQNSYNSGQFGIASGATSEAGRWSQEGARLHLRTDEGAEYHFGLDLRNTRKGEPQIVLDGKAYVTKFPRPPWPV